MGGTAEVTPTGATEDLPVGRSFPVKECLDTFINEEWWHRHNAERDLAALEDRHQEES